MTEQSKRDELLQLFEETRLVTTQFITTRGEPVPARYSGHGSSRRFPCLEGGRVSGRVHRRITRIRLGGQSCPGGKRARMAVAHHPAPGRHEVAKIGSSTADACSGS